METLLMAFGKIIRNMALEHIPFMKMAINNHNAGIKENWSKFFSVLEMKMMMMKRKNNFQKNIILGE